MKKKRPSNKFLKNQNGKDFLEKLCFFFCLFKVVIKGSVSWVQYLAEISLFGTHDFITLYFLHMKMCKNTLCSQLDSMNQFPGDHIHEQMYAIILKGTL